MSQSGTPSSPPGAGAPPSGAGARKPDASKTPLNKRAYTLNLTFSSLLTAGIVTLIGVSWVFLLGVMVGRGYNPDVKVHEFTERVLRGRRTPVVQEPPQAILRPDELIFGAALRDRPLHNSTAAVVMPPSQTPTRQSNSTAAAGALAASAQTVQPPTQLVPRGAQPASFDVIYQVATFQGTEQADKLRERLEGEGVRTTLEKHPAKDGKNRYLVLVARRGTEEDTQQLLAVLDRLKLGPPLLRSKKPASGGTGAR